MLMRKRVESSFAEAAGWLCFDRLRRQKYRGSAQKRNVLQKNFELVCVCVLSRERDFFLRVCVCACIVTVAQ